MTYDVHIYLWYILHPIIPEFFQHLIQHLKNKINYSYLPVPIHLFQFGNTFSQVCPNAPIKSSVWDLNLHYKRQHDQLGPQFSKQRKYSFFFIFFFISVSLTSCDRLLLLSDLSSQLSFQSYSHAVKPTVKCPTLTDTY